MAFNGSGVFVRLYTWVNDAMSGIKIRADRMDNEMDGFATGLTNCITKDGQTTITANLKMSGFRHTNVADGVNKNEYATVNQLMNGFNLTAVSVGGTADAITVGYSPAYTALTTGMEISFIASADNTTAVTINLDGIGVKALTKNGTIPLVAKDILSGQSVIAKYDGTRFQLLTPTSEDLITASGSAGVQVKNSGGTTVQTIGANNLLATNFAGATNDIKGADLASAATTDIGAATGNLVHITGTTTITSLGTAPQAGTSRTVIFDGILTITHNASTLVCLGNTDVVTAANDRAVFIADTTAKWIMVEYIPAAIPARPKNLTMDNYAYFRDEKISGTVGPSYSSGIQTCTLNTTSINNIVGASLNTGTNRVTLPAGTYYFSGSVSGVTGGNNKCRIYNVTDATYVLEGRNGYTGVGTASVNQANTMTVKGQIIITSAKDFELRYYTSSGSTGVFACSQGAEVYEELEIWKIA